MMLPRIDLARSAMEQSNRAESINYIRARVAHSLLCHIDPVKYVRARGVAS